MSRTAKLRDFGTLFPLEMCFKRNEGFFSGIAVCKYGDTISLLALRFGNNSSLTLSRAALAGRDERLEKFREKSICVFLKHFSRILRRLCSFSIPDKAKAALISLETA